MDGPLKLRLQHPSSSQLTDFLGGLADGKVTGSCLAMLRFASCGQSKTLLG
jgi:hypothetical protein